MSQSTNGKVTTAMTVLTITLIAALAGSFAIVQSLFPWMTIFNRPDPVAHHAHTAQVLDVTSGGPTVAEQALTRALGVAVPELRAGWQEVRPTGGVPGVSFGFGCDPADGLAPVVAQSRSWVQTGASPTYTATGTATGTLDVSARAYPAGGGAVAFEDMTQAVLGCSSASLSTSTSNLGVEVVQVSTTKTTSLVWRRGDVLMVATITSHGQPTSADPVVPALTRLDRSLDAALATTCPDQRAGVEEARRSPYVNRKAFYGNYRVEQVQRQDTGEMTAEARTTDPVVPIPGKHFDAPDESVLPTPPVPALTSGPTSLPVPVPSPTEPKAPAATAKDSVSLKHKIADPTGPGCGWAFTGQSAPTFDATTADAAFAQEAATAQAAMAQAWSRWQDAKVAYYAAYAKYATKATAYQTYAAQVEQVRAAWAVVDQARAQYHAALQTYTKAVAALAQWKADRAQARAAYKAAVALCRTQVPPGPTQPTPTSPSGTPTSPVDPTVPVTPTVPTATASSTPTVPPMVCPAPRPKILDATAPTVPASPVPDPAAQLPVPVSSGSVQP